MKVSVRTTKPTLPCACSSFGVKRRRGSTLCRILLAYISAVLFQGIFATQAEYLLEEVLVEELSTESDFQGAVARNAPSPGLAFSEQAVELVVQSVLEYLRTTSKVHNGANETFRLFNTSRVAAELVSDSHSPLVLLLPEATSGTFYHLQIQILRSQGEASGALVNIGPETHLSTFEATVLATDQPLRGKHLNVFSLQEVATARPSLAKAAEYQDSSRKDAAPQPRGTDRRESRLLGQDGADYADTQSQHRKSKANGPRVLKEDEAVELTESSFLVEYTCEDRLKLDGENVWEDLEFDTCEDYVKSNYCTEQGGYGSAWQSTWGDFSLYAEYEQGCCGCGNDYNTAPYACCGCGGGIEAFRTCDDEEDTSHELVHVTVQLGYGYENLGWTLWEQLPSGNTEPVATMEYQDQGKWGKTTLVQICLSRSSNFTLLMTDASNGEGWRDLHLSLWRPSDTCAIIYEETIDAGAANRSFAFNLTNVNCQEPPRDAHASNGIVTITANNSYLAGAELAEAIVNQSHMQTRVIYLNVSAALNGDLPKVQQDLEVVGRCHESSAAFYNLTSQGFELIGSEGGCCNVTTSASNRSYQASFEACLYLCKLNLQCRSLQFLEGNSFCTIIEEKVTSVMASEHCTENRALCLDSNSGIPESEMCYLDGVSQFALFHVDGAINLTISHLKLLSGRAESGSAVHAVNGAIVHVHNTTMANMNSTKFAAMYLVNAELDVDGGFFFQNHVQYAIHTSVLYGKESYILFVNSEFIDNNGAVEVSNGALHINNSSAFGNYGLYGTVVCSFDAIVTIINFQARNNTADDGGGVFSMEYSVFTLTNSIFMYNMAPGAEGGVLWSMMSNVSIADSVMNSNMAKTGGCIYFANSDTSTSFYIIMHLSGVAIEQNTAYLDGGAIYLSSVILDQNAILILDNTVLKGNFAPNNGAGIYGGEGTVVHGNNLTISFHTSHFASGAGVFMGYSSVLHLHHSTLNHNSALYGGVLYTNGGHVELEGCAGIMNNAASSGGFAVVERGEFVATDSSFANNSAFLGGQGMISDGSKITLLRCSLSSNRAQSGGSIYLKGMVTMAVNDSTFEYNDGVDRGGGIYCYRSDVSMNRVSIAHNSALSGGGSYWNMCLVNCMSVLFAENHAVESGGAVHTVSATMVFTFCAINHNMGSIGGAFYFSEASSELYVNSSTFLTNRAGTSGSILATVRGVTALIWNVSMGTTAVSAFYLYDGGKVAIHDSRLEQTAGGMKQAVDTLEMGSMLIAVNSVVHLERVQVTTQLTRDEVHSKYSESLAVLQIETSRLTVADSVFTGIPITVISLKAFSILKLSSTVISDIFATSGPAVVSDVSSTMCMAACDIVNNEAMRDGGAMRLEGEFQIVDSRFIGNKAVSGGALYLSLDVGANLTNTSVGIGQQSRRRITGTELANNSAVDGAAMYINVMDRNGNVDISTRESQKSIVNTINMSHLTITGNLATEAAAVLLWDAMSLGYTVFPPICSECVYDGNQAAYSTSTQGWASYSEVLEGDCHDCKVTGGSHLGKVLVRILDIFDQVVSVDASSVVDMEVLEGACILEGQTRTTVEGGVASFQTANLYGPPGTICTMHLSSTTLVKHSASETLAPVNMSLRMRECVVGEILTSALVCAKCPEGTLTFSNSSSQCTSCTEEFELHGQPLEGLVCHGGAEYEIEQGFWLAPVARDCPDERCFLNRIYKCETPGACTFGDAADRRGRGAEDAAELMLCDTLKFRNAVLCGGSQPPLCSYNYTLSFGNDDCTECSPFWQLLLQAISTGFGLLFALGVILTLHLPSEQANQEEEDEVNDSDAVILTDYGGCAVSIMVGYYQLLGQMPMLYPTSLLPSIMTEFLSSCSVFNFDVTFLSNEHCMLSYIYSETKAKKQKDFWLTFYFYMAYPMLIISILVLAAALYCNHARTTRKHDAKSAVHHIEYEMMVLSGFGGAALFTLMLIHPQTAMVAFQLYRCREFYYEDREQQRWVAQDLSVECYDKEWSGASGLSFFIIITFVFGFPVTVLCLMNYFRSFRLLRVRRADFVELLPDLPGSMFALHDIEDDFVYKQGKLWRLLGWSRKMAAYLIMSESKKGLDQQKQQALSDISEEPEKPKALKKKARGSGMALHSPFRPGVKLPREMGTHLDVFIRKSFYLEKGEPGFESCDQAQKSPRAHSSGDTKRASIMQYISVWADKQPELLPSKSHAAGSSFKASEDAMLLRPSVIGLKHGKAAGRRVEVQVAEMMEAVKGTESSVRVPVTLLQTPIWAKVLGQFWEPYEHRRFYWHCYEIFR
ncbi:hypothetical protein CYMTET_12423 [Cymbomonas tetramitiformis]|uniref:Uncharacterized protein n=1 Tax=Cymbomonas tetramitiformis TaxID=36881 RepID=A0AAE0LBV2_9CHLO|nr:hypothetical protein CYMTET_12423 [Cymbomonas tetramitiformis]